MNEKETEEKKLKNERGSQKLLQHMENIKNKINLEMFVCRCSNGSGVLNESN